MKFKSTLVASGSGSMGGTTLSRNRYGMYLRTRAMPVNPTTAAQQVVRAEFGALVTRWLEVLTPAQRIGWQTYAANVPLTSSLGDPQFVTGQNMYVRSNVSRFQAGLARVDAAPSVFDLGSFSPPGFTVSAATDQATILFTIADAWRSETGAAMVIYQGLPQNPSRTFYGGPWRQMAVILGNTTTPPASPQTRPLVFAAVVGQLIPFYVRVCRVDGRLSTVAKTLIQAAA